jgi:hypothetical protein
MVAVEHGTFQILEYYARRGPADPSFIPTIDTSLEIKYVGTMTTYVKTE